MNAEQKALKLAELKQSSQQALASGDIDAWLDLIHQELRLIEELQELLLEQSVVVVKDERAAKVLWEIDVTDLDDLSSIGERLLYSWFAPRDYALGLSRANALIAPIPIPNSLRVFVNEARQCYAFGQASAVYSLSRTILETAFTDICIGIGFIPPGFDIHNYYEEYPPHRRIKAVSKGKLRRRIFRLYSRTSLLIHGSKTVHGVESLEVLVESLALVNQLYELHKHAVQQISPEVFSEGR